MKATPNNMLVKANSQDFDGIDIFEIAKRGSLHLKPCPNEQSTTVSSAVTDDKEECELPAWTLLSRNKV